MKFSLKRALAAAALLTSGTAFAAQNLQTDLYLEVYDTTSTNTFMIDLGVSAGNTGLAGSYNLESISTANGVNTGQDWTSFITGNTAHTFDFYLVGGNSNTNNGDLSYITNGEPLGGLATASLSSLFGTATTVPAVLMFNSVALNAGILPAANSASFQSLITNGVSTGTVLSNAGGTPYATSGSVLDLAYYTGAASTKGTVIDTVSLNVSTGTLTITAVQAVPEPGTYALMAAGLLAVGAIVRRRSRS